MSFTSLEISRKRSNNKGTMMQKTKGYFLDNENRIDVFHVARGEFKIKSIIKGYKESLYFSSKKKCEKKFNELIEEINK